MESDLPGEDFFGYPPEIEKTKDGKPGRPIGIDAETLRRNVIAIQFALEQNWGEVGWALSQAGTEADIRIAFKMIVNPRCSLLDLFTTETTVPAESGLRELRKEARKIVKRLEDHRKDRRRLSDASDRAFFALESEPDHVRRLQFLSAHAGITRDLEEVTKLEKNCRADFHELVAELENGEAHFAQSEILKYIQSNRRRFTPRNIARAMAGLPILTARVSDERCTRDGINPPNGVMFEILLMIQRHFKEPIKNLSEAIDSLQLTIGNMQEKRHPYVSDFRSDWFILESAIRSAADDPNAIPGSFAFRVLNQFRRNTTSNGSIDFVSRATLTSTKEDSCRTAPRRWGG